jgi:hypothetical protein
MSVGATRKIGPSATTSARSLAALRGANNQTQFVENIDTTNNVFVGDETGEQHKQNARQQQSAAQDNSPSFNDDTPDLASSLETLALSGVFEDTPQPSTSQKVNVYNNNQAIVKDEEIERTGRSYLKHFYEKNEPLIDVDELV